VEVDLLQVLSLNPKTLSRFGVVIAEAHDLENHGVREFLGDLLDSRGRPPVLLLTSTEPDNIRLLKDLAVEDLAWAFERDEEVLARALRLSQTPDRIRLGQYFLQFDTHRACVKSALRRVFLDPDPISTVRDLARECFVSPRTLERTWKASRPEGCSLCLKDLLDWCLLLRARECHRRGLSPHEVAKVLGIHARTLNRIASRLTTRSYLGLLELGQDELRRLVDREFLGQASRKSRSA
jgi:hypothetical protein